MSGGYITQFRSTLLYKNSRPDIRLNKELIKEIAELNADLVLDVYFLGSENKDSHS